MRSQVNLLQRFTKIKRTLLSLIIVAAVSGTYSPWQLVRRTIACLLRSRAMPFSSRIPLFSSSITSFCGTAVATVISHYPRHCKLHGHRATVGCVREVTDWNARIRLDVAQRSNGCLKLLVMGHVCCHTFVLISDSIIQEMHTCCASPQSIRFAQIDTVRCQSTNTFGITVLVWSAG